MSESVRKKIIVGNWKMYKTIHETESFISKLAPLVSDSPVAVWLAVPYTAIKTASEAAGNTRIGIGAQNMNDATEGAFTGEIAAEMLKEAGAKFVILGHSERRQLFNETNEFINRKIKRALNTGLTPLLCVGETSEERENGTIEEVLKKQLALSLDGISFDQLQKTVIAYEPIWAIGTGKTATPDQAQEAHHLCRKLIGELWGNDVASQLTLLYGGSVKPQNARQLMEQNDVDGLLVGGASLSVESFSQIVNFQKALTY